MTAPAGSAHPWPWRLSESALGTMCLDASGAMIGHILPHTFDAILAMRAEAYAAGARAGQEAMRERAAQEMDCGCQKRAELLAAETKVERWTACGSAVCGAENAHEIRALPIVDIQEPTR